jgi:hypothetical protein
LKTTPPHGDQYLLLLLINNSHATTNHPHCSCQLATLQLSFIGTDPNSQQLRFVGSIPEITSNCNSLALILSTNHSAKLSAPAARNFNTLALFLSSATLQPTSVPILIRQEPRYI